MEKNQLREINGHNGAKEVIKSSHGFLETIFSSMDEAIVVLDINGSIVDFNDAFAHICRFKNKEETLRSIDSFATIFKAYHFDGSPLPVEEWSAIKALNGDSGSNFEYIIERTDINEKWAVSTNYAPLSNGKGEIIGAVQTLHDITEHKEAEDALRKSEEQYRILFDSIDEGFCIIEMIFDTNNKPIDYRFLEMNPAFEKQTGLYDAESKTVLEMVPEHEEHWFEIYGEIALTGKSMRFENPAAALSKYYDVYAFKIGGPESRQVAVLFNDISERKKAELEIQKLLASIQEEKDKLSSLVNSIPDEVWFADAKRNLELVNPSVVSMFGNDLEGKKVEEIAGKSEVYRPDGTPRPVEEAPPLRALKGENVKNEGEIVRIPTTGELHHRQVNSMPVKDAQGNIIGSVSVVRDITEIKKAEEALKEREELYRTVFDNSQDGFQLDKVLFDKSGQPYDWIFLDVNEAFEHQTGLKKNDVIGKRAKEVIPGIESRWISALGRVAKTGKSEHIEDYNQDTGRWYDDYIFKYREDQVGILFRDITPRKNAEKRLKEAINELKRSNKELEQFAYVSSHDLQEPLRTIASFTQLLERRYKGKFDSDADEFMEYIVEAAVRMKEQIEGLLEYSRVATKGRKFKPTDMNEIIKITNKILNTSIEKSKAKITCDKLPTVMGDADQLQRVFQNIISNAIKFRKSEEHPLIHISSYKDLYNKEYIFSIKDNGIGIEKEYTERIFTIFQRLHTMDEYKGTGIGLSIVKKIIERHGGRIWVESEFNKGSTFYFTIPVKPIETMGQFLKSIK